MTQTTIAGKNAKTSPFLEFAKNKGSVLMFLVLWIIAALSIDSFATTDNMLTVIKQAAIPIIACIGMTLVLTTGGIDLSLGYTLGLCSIVLGILVMRFKMTAFPAILITLSVGGIVGLMNGFFIQCIKVPAFIATLGSGYILFGLAQIVGQGEAYYRLPKDLVAFGNTKIAGIPSYVYIAALMVLAFYFVRHKSVYGRCLSAFGYNANTSRLSGIKTARLHILTYVICSMLAALTGILLTIRVDCAQSNLGGSNYTFEIVTAAVVGGASLFGGSSSIVGSVFGVLVMKILENSINLLGVNYYLYQAAMGIIILIAIILEVYKNRKL